MGLSGSNMPEPTTEQRVEQIKNEEIERQAIEETLTVFEKSLGLNHDEVSACFTFYLKTAFSEKPIIGELFDGQENWADIWRLPDATKKLVGKMVLKNITKIEAEHAEKSEAPTFQEKADEIGEKVAGSLNELLWG